jgi:SAM-dependent methyltransferase
MSDNARKTDDDWLRIGLEEPYWGVLTDDRFARRNIDAAAISEFYSSGQSDMEALVAQVSRLFGPWKTSSNALDFGCGVGRLSFAMTRWSSFVTGYDISPGMLDVARSRCNSRPDILFTREFPNGPFDWINSYIVFQHMPPKQGLEILDRLLQRLSENGLLTLHFTLYRDVTCEPAHPRMRTGLGRALRQVLGRPPNPPVGAISMYDYDLGSIVERLNARGVRNLLLIHTQHGGHHGAQIIGRRGE